ncbi:hypothetical protein GCM10027427_04190 [Pseudoclavibacter terrae]
MLRQHGVELHVHGADGLLRNLQARALLRDRSGSVLGIVVHLSAFHRLQRWVIAREGERLLLEVWAAGRRGSDRWARGIRFAR